MAMYCRSCGTQNADTARFCSKCGTELPAAAAYTPQPRRPLVRPRAGRIAAGVCQGLANQYGWDAAWVRVITVLLAVFAGGLGLVAYVVLWVVTPDEPLALPPVQPYVGS